MDKQPGEISPGPPHPLRWEGSPSNPLGFSVLPPCTQAHWDLCGSYSECRVGTPLLPGANHRSPVLLQMLKDTCRVGYVGIGTRGVSRSPAGRLAALLGPDPKGILVSCVKQVVCSMGNAQSVWKGLRQGCERRDWIRVWQGAPRRPRGGAASLGGVGSFLNLGDRSPSTDLGPRSTCYF